MLAMTVQPQAAKNNRRLWSAAIGAGLSGSGLCTKAMALPVTRQSGPPRPRASQKARRAWFEVIRLFYSAIGKHRVVSIAAGVTFFALLAIFPAIAALVAIYGLFSDPATIQGHLNELSSLLPGGAIEIIGDQLQRVASGGTTALGATFLVSLAISLWSANAGMKAMFDALNIVYGANQNLRGLIKLNAVSLTFTAGGLLVLALAIGAIAILPIALNYIGLGSVGD